MANQVINVIVNSKGAVTVIRELNAMGDSARQTTTFLNGLRSVLAAALTFSGVGAIVDVVDTFTTLTNRLKQVADESNTVGESWTRLMGIANNSYSTIESTVDLYFRVAQAYKAWGESAEEAYKFTDLFQKAAILSGSSMQTTAQAVYQFSQALNKGKLDGDEFRSVLEGLPYVATLLQKELGVTRSELYQMSAAGEISLDKIKRAFENAAKTIQGDWANVTPTIAMALNVLRNEWINFIGEVQTSTGVFSLVAYLIIGIANNFDLLAIALAPVVISLGFLAGRLGIGLVVLGFKELTTALGLATAAQWLFNAAVAMNPYVLIGAAILAMVAGIIYFRNELGLTNENLAIFWQSAVAAFTAVIGVLSNMVSFVVRIVQKMYEWTSLFPLILKGAMMLAAGIVVVFNNIMDIVSEAASYIAEAFIPVWNDIKAIVMNVYELIKEFAMFIIERLTPAFTDLKSAWDILYNALRPGLAFVLDILGKIGEGLEFLVKFLGGIFTKTIKVVFDGWVFILRSVLSFINNIITALRTALALLKAVAGAGGGGGGGGGGGAHYGAQFKAGEGFATGGRFKVGGTGAGRDTTPVAFRAERGERVTVETKKQQRVNDNQQTAANVNVPVQVVNVLDPSMIIAAMETASGARVITNIIKANRDEINNTLGAS
jgi:tape measure domain-containing protein